MPDSVSEELKLSDQIREQARFLKTVKDHSVIAKSSMVQTVGGDQACQSHALYSLSLQTGSRTGWVAKVIKSLLKVTHSAQCTVGPIQAKSNLVASDLKVSKRE